MEHRIVSKAKVEIYELPTELTNIVEHIYISKQITNDLANYISKENWGNDNILLYKYLDYIWRFQLIDKQVKIFKYKNQYRLIFHTGLFKRDTNDYVYIMIIPNEWCNNTTVKQKWRIPRDYRYKSFLTKHELIRHFKFNRYDVPNKTNFLKNNNDAMFHDDYTFIFNLNEKINNTKARILKCLPTDMTKPDIDDKDLSKLILKSVNASLNIAKKDANYVGKQVFIERDIVNNNKITKGYHLELLLPVTLNISDIDVHLALVLRSNHISKQYYGMSIITRDMAYINSRLIGEVTLSWLKPFVNKKFVPQSEILPEEPQFLNAISSTSASELNINIGSSTDDELSLSPKSIESNITEYNNNSNNNNNNNINININSINNINNDFNIKSLLDDSYFNNNINISQVKTLIDNPFFYIETVLPLRLPKIMTQQNV